MALDEKKKLKDEFDRLKEVIQNVVEWGELTIIVKRGKPVMVKEGIKEIKLD